MTMLTFAVVLFALFNLSLALTEKEGMVICMQQHSVKEDIVKHFMQNGEVPDENNKNQKCYFHCIMNKFGIADNNGNMDMGRVKEMMITRYEKMTPESVVTLMDKCSARSETDPCDKIYQFHKCHMKPYLELAKAR